MLVSLGTLLADQSKGTEDTKYRVAHLLDYCATNPDTKLRYHDSNMTLIIHSDIPYLSETHARSRVGGHFFLGPHNFNNTSEPNGEILTLSNITKNTMS